MWDGVDFSFFWLAFRASLGLTGIWEHFLDRWETKGNICGVLFVVGQLRSATPRHWSMPWGSVEGKGEMGGSVGGLSGRGDGMDGSLSQCEGSSGDSSGWKVAGARRGLRQDGGTQAAGSSQWTYRYMHDMVNLLAQPTSRGTQASVGTEALAGSADLAVWQGSPPGRSRHQRPQSQLVGALPGVVVPESLGSCHLPCYHHPLLLPQLPAVWLSWLLWQQPGETWLLLWLLLPWWVQLLASDEGNKHEKSLNVMFIQQTHFSQLFS